MSKKTLISEIIPRIIFFGYNPRYLLLSILYRGLLVNFFVNILFLLSYWCSYIYARPIDIFFIPALMNQNKPVAYLAENIHLTIPYSLSLVIIWIASESFVRRKELKNDPGIAPVISPNNIIKRVYTGETRTFLLPINNGRIKIFVILSVMFLIWIFMYYNFSWILYEKLYNSIFYNNFLDFKAQSLFALFCWSVFFLIIYQFCCTATIGLLVGIYQVAFAWNFLKKHSRIPAHQNMEH